MAEQAAKEPTMEEILASIRRIISEGGEPEADISEASVATPKLTEVAHDDSLDEAFDVSELLGDQDNEPAPAENEHLLSVEELLGSSEVDFGDYDEDSPLEVDDITLPPLSEDISAEPQADLDDAFEADTDVMSDLDSLLDEVNAIEAAAETPEPAAFTPEPKPMPQPIPAPVTPSAASPAAVSTAAALTGNSTLEGLVSELMRPVIKEWIDNNLPAMVERRVEAEINQIATKVISALRDA